MSNFRKSMKFVAEPLGPRRVIVQCSSAVPDRSGDIVVQQGIKFAASVPALFGHDANIPVGRAAPKLVAGSLFADVEFAPAGVSERADEICGLVKAGVIDTVSIGFDPIKSVQLDPKNPYGPKKFLSCELLELSFVSVPANPDARVVGRSRGNADDDYEARQADLRALEERFWRLNEIDRLRPPSLDEIEAEIRHLEIELLKRDE